MMAKATPFLGRERKDTQKRVEAVIIYFAFIEAMAIPAA